MLSGSWHLRDGTMTITLPRVSVTTVWRYGIAFVAVLVAVLLKLLLLGVTDDSPFLLLLSAVMIAAWNGGLGPGLLATFLAALVTDYFFLTPGHFILGNAPGQNVGLLLFVFEGLLVSWLSSLLHGARRHARASASEAGQYQDSLLQAEAQFRLLVEGIKDYAIFMLDTEGHVVTWSEAAQRMMGYEANEVTARPFACLSSGADGQQNDSLRTALLTGRCEQELWCARKDGSRFWADVVVAALRDKSGKPRGFTAVVRDMTERKRTEEANQRRAEQLAEANRLKDDFLAVVSHELRQPLNSILGWAQLLRRGKLDEEGRAQAMETIEQSAKTQTRLIDDLLDVSRIISGRMRLDIALVQLAEVVETTIDTVRPAADAKRIRIETELDPLAGPVSGDPIRLQQVTWNLLFNAVKFTPHGGLVRVQLRRASSHVELTIEDTGAGIPPDFLPHVFEPFHQADGSSTRSHKGLGLGLAIVENLVQLHGGTVDAESAGDGQGSRFRVMLPLAPIHARARSPQPVRSAAQASESIEFTNSLSGLRVVIVDDEAGARVLLTAMLHECGAEVTAVESAAAALAAIQQLKPDVLVSDIEMPGEDGYTLIRTVRDLAAENGGQTPALALTGYARPEDRRRALAAGFQMHLAKPVEPNKLAGAVLSLARQNPQFVGR